MRIGIDARMYGPRQGGLGRYVEQLILHLEKIPTSAGMTEDGKDNLEFVVFLRRENWDEFTPANPRFKKVLADVPWYGWREQIFLPFIFARERVNLMHFPHWNIPLFYPGKFVVTIHDLLLLNYPTKKSSTLGPMKYWFKQLAYKIVLWSATRRAEKIITVSEFSKRDIIKKLRTPAEKISVTYLAPAPPATGTPVIDPKKYGLNKPFALYVGVGYPHKNLERLLSVWDKFQKSGGGGYTLALAGKNDYFYERLKTEYLSVLNVVFTDFVPDDELGGLYQSAALLIYPSLYEGAGLPPLEAMGHNLPVAASNRSSLPEILGDAALYFDPENETEMLSAIQRGLTDKNLRQKLIVAGQKLYPTYSWRKTVELTEKIYRSVDK